MNDSRIVLIGYALIMLMLTSCKQGIQPLKNVLKGELSVKVNPYGKSPLTAEVSLISDKKGTTSYTVLGSIPVSRNFSTSAYNHQIPIVGLYPNTDNKVSIEYKVSDTEIYVDTLMISTDPLPEFIPEIDVVKADRSRMEDGFHLIEQLIANNGKFLTYTIMYDDDGKIRWYMDMSSTGQITYTCHRLKNGNWLYLSWIDIYEVDDLGKVVSKEQMWNYAGDHDLMELENGNILMGGSKKDAFIVRPQGKFNSRFDFVVEWDRRQNKGVKAWDLRKVLDVDRSVYPADFSLDFNSDWFHINSVDVNPNDGHLLISGRNQGVLEVDGENNLQYILAPHKGWDRAGYDGNGMDLKPYLLTAIDNEGKALPQQVQLGNAGTDDFEWPTGQHSATFLDNGNILLFDNGLMRNFSKDPTYSRAVEYAIDRDAKTIRQVWQYGKEKGLEMHSPITSGVQVLSETGNRLITAGNVRRGSIPPHAKMIEVTYPGNKEVFEAHIFFKDALGTKAQEWAQFDLVYRGARYPLIPD